MFFIRNIIILSRSGSYSMQEWLVVYAGVAHCMSKSIACRDGSLYNIYSMLVVLYHAGVLVLYQKYIMQEWLVLYLSYI